MDKPKLLVQMETMMTHWDTVMPVSEDSSFEEKLNSKLYRLETCRSVVSLFISGSGVYKPMLQKVHHYLFDLVDDLVSQRRAPAAIDAVATSVSRHGPGGELVAIEDEDMSKFDFAFNRVSRANHQMKKLALDADKKRSAHEVEVVELKERVAKLEELLKFQDGKMKRSRREEVRNVDAAVLVNQLQKEKTVEELETKVSAKDGQIEQLQDSVKDLRILNGKYAQQVVELAARMRVYNDHNQKFATLLALQQEEHLVVSRENELLAKELEEMNRFHQLREGLEGEISTMKAAFELRNVRHGLGANVSVPRHLAYCGLLNRFALPRDSALALVSDILGLRASQGTRTDFQTFIHAYLTKKHGVDAVAWGYSLDDATRFFDADVNLSMFGHVSRKHLSETLYTALHTDIGLFLEACELIDHYVHEEVSLTVPLVHVIGILMEMYPSYPESAFKKLLDALQSTLTSTATVHYRMLFPNLERDLLRDAGTTFSGLDLRRENEFSATFKELLVDDATVTVQQLEDHVHHLGLETISIDQMANVVVQIFDTEEIQNEVVEIVKGHFQEYCAHGEVLQLPKAAVLGLLREKTLFRKGVFRTEAAFNRNSKLFATIQSQLTPEGISIDRIDYVEVLQKCETRRVRGAEAEQDDVNVHITM